MVFDPGIDEDSLVVLDAVASTLCHAYGVRPASFREAEFVELGPEYADIS